MNERNVKGALVLTHLSQEGSCSLGRILIERGFRVKTLNVPQKGIDDIDPLKPDLLVVMGGPVGVYQADDYPFIGQEIEILKARLAADKPTIGICLGSQMMAKALGSNVYPGAAGKELGWYPLQVSAAGQDSPARYLDGAHTQMFNWHGDTFDLPEGVELLASSAQYANQIYTHGHNALGLQCHPEVMAQQLQEWFVMFTGQITGPDALVKIETLRAETAEHVGRLNTQAGLFFHEWLDERGL
jgi:GMP synthase (glutamine-hydrolysing)